MFAQQAIREKYGRNICRNCINRLCRAKLNSEDCTYDAPYPQLCPCCGEMRHIVSGLRLSGRLKLLGKTPDLKE